jgi:hypothetical protein
MLQEETVNASDTHTKPVSSPSTDDPLNPNLLRINHCREEHTVDGKTFK